VQEAADVKYYRSDEPLRLGIEHFNRGNYGIAERYFRDAVEKAPKELPVLIWPTAPTITPSSWPARRRRSSTIKATRTCCAAN
jgi:hypothetical protein